MDLIHPVDRTERTVPVVIDQCEKRGATATHLAQSKTGGGRERDSLWQLTLTSVVLLFFSQEPLIHFFAVVKHAFHTEDCLKVRDFFYPHHKVSLIQKKFSLTKVKQELMHFQKISQ